MKTNGFNRPFFLTIFDYLCDYKAFYGQLSFTGLVRSRNISFSTIFRLTKIPCAFNSCYFSVRVQARSHFLKCTKFNKLMRCCLIIARFFYTGYIQMEGMKVLLKVCLHCRICNYNLFLFTMGCIGIGGVVTVIKCEHFH